MPEGFAPPPPSPPRTTGATAALGPREQCRRFGKVTDAANDLAHRDVKLSGFRKERLARACRRRQRGRLQRVLPGSAA
eukprot:5459871-Pyramimonas_sp.AAC.1